MKGILEVSAQDVVFAASDAARKKKSSKIRLKEPRSTTKKKKTLQAKSRILRTQIDQIAETSLNLKLSCLIKKSSKKLKLKSSKSLKSPK